MIAGVGPLGLMTGGRDPDTGWWTVLTFWRPPRSRRVNRVAQSHVSSYVTMAKVDAAGMVHRVEAETRAEALRLARIERAAQENARLRIEREIGTGDET